MWSHQPVETKEEDQVIYSIDGYFEWIGGEIFNSGDGREDRDGTKSYIDNEFIAKMNMPT